MKQDAYLKPGRLSEVLALIQVLAYDKITSRSEDPLSLELQRIPATQSSWTGLASEHPEFFRVREGNDEVGGDKKTLVSLVSRFVLPKIQGTPNRPPLDKSIVNKLMEIAIDIQDRQVARRNRWWKFLPTFGVLIAVVLKWWLDQDG